MRIATAILLLGLAALVVAYAPSGEHDLELGGFDDQADYSLGMRTINKPTVRNATTHICAKDNRRHRLTYSSLGHGDEYFVTLNEQEGLMSIDCDVSANHLKLNFVSSEYLNDFLNNVKWTESFMIGTQNFTCEVTEDGQPKPLIRRVMSGEIFEEESLILRTVHARYDELFSDMQVSLERDGDCTYSPLTAAGAVSNSLLGHDHEWGSEFCIGVNAGGAKCDQASSSIPIYQNQYIDIECSDCFFGFGADIFFELDLSTFHVERVSAGFKDVNLNAALVFTANFHANWGTGVDKQLALFKPTTLVDFHIGPVPFHITFSVPLDLQADASFEAQAQAQIGATADWNFGDHYLQWNRHHGWNHVSGSPKLSWVPKLSASASFSAQASLALIPAFVLDVDNVFTYQIKATPKLLASASADSTSKQLCAQLNYDLNVVSEAQLHLDFHIGFVHAHDDHTWGPTTIYDSGVKPIAKKCINL